MFGVFGFEQQPLGKLGTRYMIHRGENFDGITSFSHSVCIHRVGFLFSYFSPRKIKKFGYADHHTMKDTLSHKFSPTAA